MGKISHHYTLEELEFIIDNLPGHIYWTDKNSVILGCNMNQAKYAGFTNKDEMIGKTDYDMPWKGYAAQIINVNNQVMATKQEIIVEEKVVLPNGKEAYFLSTKKPRYDHDGNVIGILGISTDITSQKIAEEQEKQAIAQIAAEKALAQAEREQRRTLGVIGADIGHDLRTYLGKLSARVSQFSNAWLAFSSNEKYFPDLSDDEVTLNYLTAIDPFAEHMQKDIQQLAESISATLKLMRNVDAGTINRDDFNIYEIEPCIWNVLNYYPFAAGEKELVHFDSSQNFSFLGHHVLFYRILFNLMNNALQQITKNKRGEIFISTEEDEQYNILRFRDTAGGAAPEIVKHLFEGFKTTKKDGNGVGLAFCKITMHSFKGDITCHSVEGDYIEFVLSFPKIANETQQLI